MGKKRKHSETTHDEAQPQKECTHLGLIRALAVRTMGCVRVDKITEYLCDPLQRCLNILDNRCTASKNIFFSELKY
ncbi:hypothetical protein JHK82_044521 [Glycine max]|uniref:Condensin complex subunit 1 C-terminal domain-containing protein n=2 Tax=Glycine subgen. Soja TaxID=1462606 RepID=K7MG53_SOYBN|nr:hypothetical protein JHK86_044863 [Glycine max]KAG4940843.1 hypothetical protein JHK87_044714 [Glycine soja]KAG4951611.1 hypothetical protein JHK85_045478 [Glycine max]KAG5099469.1 hypothetical protein JHK82_044521 [Glycine max]KAG5108070.1 hypothetical protein JHK84_044977 [Glycine max]